jgi:AraC-like DNA-binding protein
MALKKHPKVYLYRRIVQAKLYIDSHYTEDLVLSAIADEAHFSKFHFIRLFKKIFGKTPHQYLTTVRIENAMRSLQADTPVSEVCYSVGFESLTSFTVLFKRVVGLTPSLYRTQEQLKAAQILQAPLRFVPSCFAHKNGWTKKSNFEETVL